MQHSNSSRLPYIIAAIALLLTLIVWMLIVRSVDLYNTDRFKNLSRKIQDDISFRLNTYINAMSQTQAMVSVSPLLTRRAFKEYVQKLNFSEEYPGIEGIGIVERVQANEVPTHISQVKSEGFPHYRIWPKARGKKEHFTVTNLEPQDKRNARILGNDLSTDPVKYKAMLQARDSGKTTASGIVKLVQEKNRPAEDGFILFAPLYRYRTRNLAGFIFSAVNTDRFFDDVFQEINPNFPIDFEIYLSDKVDPAKLVYDHDGKNSFRDPNFAPGAALVNPIKIGGQTWTIYTYTLPKFTWGFYQSIPTLVLCTGLLISGLLFWITQIHTSRADLELSKAKELEAAARENAVLYEQAQAALAARDEFLSIASHEFKTPLASLKLQIQSLVRYIEKGSISQMSQERFEKMASVFVTQLGRLNDLVNNLLDVTRARAGKLTLNKEVINVVEVINEIIDRFKVQIEDGQTSIHVFAPAEIVGCFDRTRIEQITENLLSNAAKYAAGKPVNLTLVEDNGRLRMEVQDRGVGISPENIGKIFEKFERVSENDESVSGLGLGLYITKQIVDAHGGVIHVQSQENLGTTFTVELPMGNNLH